MGKKKEPGGGGLDVKMPRSVYPPHATHAAHAGGIPFAPLEN